jgi:hypothetical protein
MTSRKGGKRVNFGSGRGGQDQAEQPDPDAWVASRDAEKLKMKRLTLDIDEDLHRRIKVRAAERGTRIVDDLRAILDEHYRQN